ncbi:hypothetical protein FRC16_001285, partial [Serendipita sp. 398]
SVSWDQVWIPRTADTQAIDDASGSSNFSSSDYSGSPSTPSMALMPDGISINVTPTYDYSTLNHNLSLLLDQLSPQKHAFLHRSVTTIASGNAPNPEDVEQLLERRNGFSCAFVNCQDHGSGKLGKRLDKAREHILIKHLTSHYVCPYCPTSTARWNDFKKHLVRKHPQFAQTSSETFTCNYCDSPKVLTTKHNLNRHLENVHSVLPQRRIRQD